MAEKRTIGVFRIIISYLNVRLNSFLSKYDDSKETERRNYGGEKDWVSTERHPWYHYTEELKEIRQNIYSVSNSLDSANIQLTESILNNLFLFYHNALADHKNKKDFKQDLDTELLLPLRKLFLELDQYFKSNHFEERINKMHLRYSGLLFKIQRLFLTFSTEKRQELERKETERLWQF